MEQIDIEQYYLEQLNPLCEHEFEEEPNFRMLTCKKCGKQMREEDNTFFKILKQMMKNKMDNDLNRLDRQLYGITSQEDSE